MAGFENSIVAHRSTFQSRYACRAGKERLMHPMLCSTVNDFMRYDTKKLLELHAALPVRAPIRAIVAQALQLKAVTQTPPPAPLT